MSKPVLIQPGIFNSGAGHWQTRWEAAHPEFRRVPQRDWDRPVCAEWVATLEAAVQQAGQQVVIVAHSLGCLTVAHWAAQAHAPIRAALLVAVPDPTGANFPVEAQGFAGVPMQPFDFPVIVVASTDDPYGSLAHAERCATAWGARLMTIGARGHINADSGLGDWAEGFAWLESLRGA